MTKTSPRKALRSGELARLAGVSVDTLRHYEARGVLARPPRAANGYRNYPPEALDRVRLVRSALALGFTLDELADVLKVRASGGAPCRHVRRLAQEKLERLEARLREMEVVRDELRATIRDWDARLDEVDGDAPAGLLEHLDEPAGRNTPPLEPHARQRRDRRRRS